MPVIIALAIRSVIQMAITLGAVSLADKILFPVVNGAIAKVIELFGVSEEDAEAFVANSVLVFAEEVGIGALTLRTKLPTKIAERLGFTSKGWNKRKLSPAGEAKLPKMGAVGSATAVMSSSEAVAVVETVAKSRGLPIALVSSMYKGIMGFVATTSLVALAVAAFIDFANWQGPFQKTFQGLLAKFGVNPDSPMPKSKAVSADTWSKIYSIVEELNPESIAFPWTGEIKPYSRNNLADAVDHFAANLALQGMQTTWKNVWGLLLPCIKLKTSTTGGGVTPQIQQTGFTTPQVQQVRVFSGLVSQGVIGSTATFTPRPDDLIEDAAELTEAAHNNLAPFIASLGSRLSYEIKIVPSVKSASGFTQRGTVQKIISGYNQNGTPRYRQVVNKFAIMNIFVRTDKGTQSKITTIVLGPVDSVRFQAANVDMTAVASSVQQNIVAPTSAPTSTPTPTVAPVVPIPARGVFMSPNEPFFGTIYKLVNGSRVGYGPFPDLYTQEERNRLSQDPGKFGQNEQKLKDRGVITSDIVKVPYIADRQPGETGPERFVSTFAEFFGATPTVAIPTPEEPKQAPQASTLFEYYKAHGQSLPGVEERSKLYEQLGLGQAAYYTGTAEQNTKLLAALQGNRL